MHRAPAVPPAPAEVDIPQRTYVVKPGDTLDEIADRLYGDWSASQDLLAANADQIADPQLICEGKKLKVPPRRQ